MRKIIVLFFALVGCAPGLVTPVYDAQGRKHLNIACQSAIFQCYQQALQSCPKGYKLIDNSERSTSGLGLANKSAALATQTNVFNIVIDCKD